MATPRRCPVCAEDLAGQPARCFRCETALESWWRFEDAMQDLASGTRAPSSRGALLLASLGLMAVALAVALLGPRAPAAPPRGAPTPAPLAAGPASPPAAERPASVRYTVQPGDSPWRIAAALTGQGRRWRELWPDAPPKLVPGMVLDLPLASPR